MSDEGELAAGEFASWLTDMRAALRGERHAEVPCDGCTACCTSSQFVHIAPEETDTLAHIPKDLVFPAPGLPQGHVVLGYDERGHCPMLVDDHCSIYAHRPRTCRTYDCRIFPATGIDVADGDASKVRIAQRARRWRFTYSNASDRDAHARLKETAIVVRATGDNATQRAVLAIESSGPAT